MLYVSNSWSTILVKLFFIHRGQSSLRRNLLVWILSAVGLFTLIEAFVLFHSALNAVNTAHDRLLRATAHSIGDSLHVDSGKLQVTVPFALLEAYEDSGGSQMIYRVSDFKGDLLTGDANLPRWQKPLLDSSLISVHDISMLIKDVQTPLRMVVLHQPLEGSEGRGIAMIQVAETLDVRSKAARELLINTLLRQILMLSLIAALIVWIVQRAVRPLRAVRQELLLRDDNSLAPLIEQGTKETQPVVNAMNTLLGHLQAARNQQQRFIANAAHQLRTPLAVLKTQLQSARTGDIALENLTLDLEKTVDRATNLTNQLLSLAKVEQMRQRSVRQKIDLTELTRQAALELSPLITAKRLDFDFEAASCILMADPWMVGELIRNLLSNAIRYSPPQAGLKILIEIHDQIAIFRVSDHGPGINTEMLEKVFEPFTAASTGAGLGLAIAKEICTALDAKISLHNRLVNGNTDGLDATVTFKL
jgi:two-component system, OmpR family, sensor histidine kinase TctE